MKTLQGVYKAVCLEVDNQAESIRCQVPQGFADETVTCFDIAGGVFPLADDQGWVVFEGGFPDHPIWLSGSEGISSPDITPGAGVIDVSAGTGIQVTGPAQHPVINNTGVISIVAGQRVTVNNSDPLHPVVSANPQYIAGGATDQVLAKASATDYDTKWLGPMLQLVGGTVTGRTWFEVGNSPGISLSGTGVHQEWWTDGRASRTGYIQGNGASGLYMNSEMGPLGLRGAGSVVNFNAESTNIGVPSKYGGAYRGFNWGSEYIIMTDGGTNTFITAPGAGGSVYIRGNANGAGLQIDSSGNLNVNNHAGTLYCETVEAGWSGIFFGSNRVSGWYVDGSSSWIRSRNNYGVWLSSGWFGCDGGITIGRGGGTSGYRGDFAGSIRVDQAVDAGWFNCGGDSTLGGNTSTGYITTRDGYRITSNGGWSGGWPNASFVAQRGSGGDRAGISVHPSGVAKQMGMLPNNGYLTFWNEDNSWYADLYAASINQVSQRRGKQDIVSWPPKSLSAGVMGAASRLSLIDVVSYRVKPEMALIEAETMRPDENGVSHQRVHDCDLDPCEGTSENPCVRVRDWSNPYLGIIIEDIATVLPEAVALDPEGNPGAVRVNSMLGYLLAVCKEQQADLEGLRAEVAELRSAA